ncbi:dienelactone hydrolase family protein [Granulicella cerasi]|uniref:Dienelactone hydrolase family protein n=1 Tax=Granulicella cerasi TaxID=741063 RepID=A0ABW1ZCB6_9BACT|nr:alpha/beta hydrolase [Granulicella cerasi]
MREHASELGGVQRIADDIHRKQERKQRSKTQRRLIAAVMLLVALVCFGIAVWPTTRAHLQAIAVLDLVGNQPVPPLVQRVVSTKVITREVTINTPNGPVAARMYEPVGKPDAPAFLVLHGVHHLGMNEPRLVAFASAIASCGLRVLTPELPDIKDYHVGANSIETIGETAKWLSQQSGGRPVSVMGLSFSGGLSLLAAADPAYRPSIKFVVAVGSQDAMSRVASYYRTGEDTMPDGKTELLPPHEYGALVLEYEHVEDFVPAQDHEAMRRLLRAHLYEDHDAENAALAQMSDAQRAEAKQLLDTTSPDTRRMLTQAELKHVLEMAGVSPDGHLKTLMTPVYLLHGEGDNIIPAAETQWMASELPSESLRAVLISPVLSHLDLDGHAPSAGDRLRLVHFFGMILADAEEE